ncbi:MAG: superoxide dismutase [Porticoccaceae bacterium]
MKLSPFIKPFLLAAVVALANGVFAGDDGVANGPFVLPELPYEKDALAPAIDADTMELHYGRHHKAYVDNLNGKVADFPDLSSTALEDIMANISTYDEVVRNNAGGHYNHSLFWELMAPPASTGEPSPELIYRLDKAFGSVDDFRKAFSDAASKVFGAGWAWLILTEDGSLLITTTANQDNPLMDVVPARGTPLLALDVWEHAYYLQYQNKRADYVERWWDVVNWHAVNERFEAAVAMPATE